MWGKEEGQIGPETLSSLQSIQAFTSSAAQILCSSCFSAAAFQDPKAVATAPPTEEGAQNWLVQKTSHLDHSPVAVPNLSTPGEEEEESSLTASLSPGGASCCSPLSRSIDFGLFRCKCNCELGLWIIPVFRPLVIPWDLAVALKGLKGPQFEKVSNTCPLRLCFYWLLFLQREWVISTLSMLALHVCSSPQQILVWFLRSTRSLYLRRGVCSIPNSRQAACCVRFELSPLI